MRRPRFGRRLHPLLLLAGVTVTVLVAVVAARPSGSPEPSVSDERTALAAAFGSTSPIELDAGTELEVPVVTDRTAEGMATAMIISAAGSERVAVPIEDGEGFFVVGAVHTRSAGLVTLVLFDPDDPSRSRTTDVRVRPIAGQHALDMNVGPTALGPSETTMAVGLLTDPLGNPVVDGTPVELTVTTADGQQRVVEIPTRSGLSVAELRGSDLAPEFRLAMSGAGSHSLVETVVVQPERPGFFELAVEGSEHRGDGRSRHVVTSTLLTDAAGRPPTDGTNVELIVEGPDGPSTIVGEVVDGRVSGTLIAPARPATVTVRAVVAGVSSEELEIVYEPAVLAFDVVFTTSQGQRRLLIGPVRDPDGGVVPDGTVVEAGDDRLQLVRGRATLELDGGVAIPTITVLGVEGTIR